METLSYGIACLEPGPNFTGHFLSFQTAARLGELITRSDSRAMQSPSPSPSKPRRRLPIFSVRRRRLGLTGLAENPAAASSRFDVVVGRELCLYARFDASRVPAKARASFLDLSVRRTAPFADPAFEAGWIHDVAHVWYWSRSRVADLIGPDRKNMRRTLCEPLLLGEIEPHDSTEVLDLPHGIEARVWRDKQLQGDRWWPNQPSAQEWLAFLRDSGATQGQDFPVPTMAPWREVPWGRHSQGIGLRMGDWQARIPLIAALTAAVAFMAVAAFELGAGFRAMSDSRATELIKAKEEKQAANVLDARLKAGEAQVAIDEMLGLLPPQQTLAMLAEVNKLMPKGQYKLVSWTQPNADHLEVTASGGSSDVQALVSAWEGSAMFTGATAEFDESTKRITVKAKVQASAPVADTAGNAMPVAEPRQAEPAPTSPASEAATQ